MKTKLFKILFVITTMFVMSSAQAVIVSGTCDIAEVAQMDIGLNTSRVHIKCATPINDNGTNIYFFSLPTPTNLTTNTSDITSRFFETGRIALTSNKQMTFYFTSGNTSGSQYACAASNCRKPLGFIIYP